MQKFIICMSALNYSMTHVVIISHLKIACDRALLFPDVSRLKMSGSVASG